MIWYTFCKLSNSVWDIDRLGSDDGEADENKTETVGDEAAVADENEAETVGDGDAVAETSTAANKRFQVS